MYQYKAKVLKVVDGDTVHVDVDLGFHVRVKMKIRLSAINAPELSEDAGKIARDRLKEKLDGQDVIVYTKKDSQEKYGRYLAEIYLDGVNINDWMLNENLAVPYE